MAEEAQSALAAYWREPSERRLLSIGHTLTMWPPIYPETSGQTRSGVLVQRVDLLCSLVRLGLQHDPAEVDRLTDAFPDVARLLPPDPIP